MNVEPKQHMRCVFHRLLEKHASASPNMCIRSWFRQVLQTVLARHVLRLLGILLDQVKAEKVESEVETIS
jgi:hypothetical protein